MADQHWMDKQGVEFGLVPPEPERPERNYTAADFEITDVDWVRNRCLAGIETLALAQDNQTEGGRAYNLWPRAEMAYRIASGGGIDPQYVTERFTEACYRCGMDQDVDNGGMRNVEVQLRRAYHKAQSNGPLPPPTPGQDLCGEAFQFDPNEAVAGHIAPDTPILQPPHPDAVASGEPPTRVLEAIEEDFWTARPSLQLVYTAALSKMASPWATLAYCAARVLCKVPPERQLPGLIGGPGSLNWFAAISAPSGGGKGAASGVAADLVPDPTLVKHSVGSGEGMVECFNRRLPKKDETPEEAMADWTTAVMFTIEEIDSLGAMGNRSGQTTMAILRQGFSGEQLGYSYRGRQGEKVADHTYRMTLVANVQPERAGVLFEDAGGGTPQRFMWFPAMDKRISAHPPDWPADPMFGYKRLAIVDPGGPGIIDIPDVVRTTILEARAARMSGDEDALDGHALYCREKFAYALAVMDGRTAISSEDWRLAGIASQVSDWCRSKALKGYVGGKERVSREKGQMRALEDDERNLVLSDVALRHAMRVTGWVYQRLQEDGPSTEGQLRKAMSSRDRPRLNDALTKLQTDGFIRLDGRVWQLVSKP